MTAFLFISFPVFVIMARSALNDECGTPGILIDWDGSGWFLSSTSYFDSADYTGSHTPWMTGSFIADSTGSHIITLDALTYGSSSLSAARVQLTFDSSTCGFSDYNCSISGVLMKDFRYGFLSKTQDHYYYVKVSLLVTSPTNAQMIMDQSRTETCHVTGCRNTQLSRSPYMCQPSPSVSASPIATRSFIYSPSFFFLLSSFHHPSAPVHPSAHLHPSELFSGSYSFTRSCHFTSSLSFTSSFTGHPFQLFLLRFSAFFFYYS
jgi:hypothetical protein